MTGKRSAELHRAKINRAGYDQNGVQGLKRVSGGAIRLIGQTAGMVHVSGGATRPIGQTAGMVHVSGGATRPIGQTAEMARVSGGATRAGIRPEAPFSVLE